VFISGSYVGTGTTSSGGYSGGGSDDITPEYKQTWTSKYVLNGWCPEFENGKVES